ncbi:hypothetical protein V1514DRAFT_336368 [Lipomyces japonicus]|uniref:uncharacterized protein n=1 Tax=Lipomyces japonicus TaxID=56871 RepID=UPI0034CDA6E1
MTRHSKRNTASSFFTAYERSLLKQYGRQRERLTGDSFKGFDACGLCLMAARDPVACPSHGHIFCRQCVVENLLSQHNEIKRMDKALKRQLESEREAHEQAESRIRDREVQDFEDAQSGFVKHPDGSDHKRKAGTDVVVDHRERARQKLQDQDTEAAKSKLASFWIPSLTPEVAKSNLVSSTPKLRPVCPAASDESDSHHISLKSLLAVHFEVDTAASGSTTRICPSCRKEFGKSLEGYLSNPCGHVICKSCFAQVMKPAHAGEKLLCFVCQHDLSDTKNGKRGVIFIKREGTGFSGGGKAIAEKKGVAFQA